MARNRLRTGGASDRWTEDRSRYPSSEFRAGSYRRVRNDGDSDDDGDDADSGGALDDSSSPSLRCC